MRFVKIIRLIKSPGLLRCGHDLINIAECREAFVGRIGRAASNRAEWKKYRFVRF